MHRHYKNEGAIQGIIGILNYGDVNYLAVIAGVQQVGQINKAKINKVTAVKLLPFSVSYTFKLDYFDLVLRQPCW